MTDQDEKLGVNVGQDELEPRKMTVPVDRKTPTSPPDPAITASEAIELIENIVRPLKLQVNDLHQLIMGSGAKASDGRPLPGFGHAMHKTNQHLSSIALTTQTTHDALMGTETRAPMANLIAAEVADRMLELFEKQLRVFQEAMRALIARVDALESLRVGPDGPEES
jgi:hypothetical protein